MKHITKNKKHISIKIKAKDISIKRYIMIEKEVLDILRKLKLKAIKNDMKKYKKDVLIKQ